MGVIRCAQRIPYQGQGGTQKRIGGRRRAAVHQGITQGLRPAQITPDLKSQSLRAGALRGVEGLERRCARLPALHSQHHAGGGLQLLP